MGGSKDAVFEAIGRWEASGLIDRALAERLRAEAGANAVDGTRRLSQYVLAATGAVVLLLAGGLFVEWAWPLLGVRARTGVLAVGGIVTLLAGLRLEEGERWRPASHLMQTAGLTLLLSAYGYSSRVWDPTTPFGTVLGVIALAIPIVTAPRAMRRSAVMPAVHLVMSLGFLALFLEQSTALSDEAIVWTLDAALVGAIFVLVRVLRDDPECVRYPWALNTFVTAMAMGFVFVPVTAIDVMFADSSVLIPLDLWLALCAGLTLWGIHGAPPGLRRAWYQRLLAAEMLAWVVFGIATVAETFDGPPEVGVLVVGGSGVAAFVHGDRHGFHGLMGAGSLGFIAPTWWWAVERGGALGGALALVATAAFLFWASGRRGTHESLTELDRSGAPQRPVDRVRGP